MATASLDVVPFVRATQTGRLALFPPELIEHIFQAGSLTQSPQLSTPAEAKSINQRTIGFGAVCWSWREAAKGNGEYVVRSEKAMEGLLELFEGSEGMAEGSKSLATMFTSSSDRLHSRLLSVAPKLKSLKCFHDYGRERIHWTRLVKAIVAMKQVESLELEIVLPQSAVGM